MPNEEIFPPLPSQKPPDPPDSNMDTETTPTTDREKMSLLEEETKYVLDRLNFLELTLARMKSGKFRKTKEDFERILEDKEQQRNLVEHKKVQIVRQNEEEALKLQLFIASNISNLKNNVNDKNAPKADEIKNKKTNRVEGFTSPIKVEVTRKWPKSRSKLSGEYLKILASTADEHREITAFLTEKNEEFHAIDPIEVRLQKVVIKGLPISTDIDVIRADLTERGFNVLKVAQLTKAKSKFKLPIFMVELKKLPSSPDIFQLETCCFLTVKIDSFNRRPGATQCYNCNLFHHSSSNCHIKTRCLKCGEPHKTGDCPIKSKIENPTALIASRKDTWQTRTAVQNSQSQNLKREKPPKSGITKLLIIVTVIFLVLLLPLCRKEFLSQMLSKMTSRWRHPSTSPSRPNRNPRQPPTPPKENRNRNNPKTIESENFGFMDARY
ncbi:putative RNA-directed DNA polymerase from transposon X-element [Trichonephila clavipes]|nr:putative RNA-directed DNA polymerase from transposon X-element [Trichonephila clavipes]